MSLEWVKTTQIITVSVPRTGWQGLKDSITAWFLGKPVKTQKIKLKLSFYVKGKVQSITIQRVQDDTTI
jgi:hypothetical protein